MMLPSLAAGRAILRPIAHRWSRVLQGNALKSTESMAYKTAVRAFSVAVQRQAEVTLNSPQGSGANETTASSPSKPRGKSNVTFSPLTKTEFEHALSAYENTGNVKGAVKLFQRLHDDTKFTLHDPKAYYRRLIDLANNAPFDMDACSTIVQWFSVSDDSSPLPKEVLASKSIWSDVLILGLHFGSTYRLEDLRALVDAFQHTFDLATTADSKAWAVVMRAYGILRKPKKINALLEDLEKHMTTSDPAHVMSLKHDTILAYAACGLYDKVDALMQTITADGTPVPAKLLQQLIRTTGFQGDVKRTKKYISMCNDLYSIESDTMTMIAFKTALNKEYEQLVSLRGPYGTPLKSENMPKLDALHSEWDAVINQLLEKGMDETQCNIALEYYTLANRIDPERYPLSKAEKIVHEYMPSRGVAPSSVTYAILLRGYAFTREYSDPKHNIRLDKALEVVAEAERKGLRLLNQYTYHGLLHACLPHEGDYYPFENFWLGSMLKLGVGYRRIPVDHRLFKIEEIMLQSNVPHDRHSIKTMLTCLGGAGLYKAMWNRWRLLKLAGMRRDVGLYQTVFSLASLNPEEARYALTVVKDELGREIKHDRITWNTYVAMLDCAVSAQMPEVAKMIMRVMRTQPNKKGGIRAPRKVPSREEPQFYTPLLRTCASIKGLETEIEPLLAEMRQHNVVNDNRLWQVLISLPGLDNRDIQRTFYAYTMQRFELYGKIPIPVRESSPAVPFPSGSYSSVDMQMIDVYIASLVDAQDVSLVVDVLKTLDEQTSSIRISKQTINAVIKLAEKEKSVEEALWVRKTILPKLHHHRAVTHRTVSSDVSN